MADRHPSTDDLRVLARGDGSPRATLFVPVEAAVPAASQNAVRMRRTIAAALARLGELGAPPERVAAARSALAPLEANDAAPAPWVRARAFCWDGEALHRFGLPFEEAERVSVGTSLALRPLVRAASRQRRYRVLALSAKRVALFEGDATGLAERAAEGLPASLEDALGPEFEKERLQFHSTGAHGGRPVYHGLGGADRERSLDQERFQHVVARALVRLLGGDDVPLVLAADQVHQAAIAKELGGALRLAREGVVGNPDHLGAHALHERAWPSVEALLRAEQDAAQAEFERARNRGKVTIGFDDTFAAAVAGRVRRLWAPLATRLPGRVDRAALRPAPPWGDEDLGDELTALVLAQGGETRVVEPGAGFPPSPDAFAAELR
jgi:hypothetical protein